MKDAELGTPFSPLNSYLNTNKNTNDNYLLNSLKRDLNPQNNFGNFKSQNQELNFFKNIPNKNIKSNNQVIKEIYQNKKYRCKKKYINEFF